MIPLKSREIILVIFLISCVSSCKDKFTASDISLPSYYQRYDFKKFWTGEGLRFDLTPPGFDGRYFKDSLSKNFIHINEGLKNIFDLSKEDRASYFKLEAQHVRGRFGLSHSNRFELYSVDYIDTLNRQPVYIKSNTFLFLNDSTNLNISYMSFQHDSKKESDYYNIINKIKLQHY